MLSILVILLVFFVLFAFYVSVKRNQWINNLSNRYVLITGCDSGFGNHLAKCLDKLGVHVFASCLTENAATKLKEQCSSQLKVLILDVTKEHDIEAAVKFVQENLPKDKALWGLVNNAGLQVIGAPIEFWDRRQVEKTLNVNLMGAVYVTQAFLPLLRKSKGRVVHVSSDAALIAWPCRFTYNISKISLESFSACIRREMYYVGVTSHTIQPGPFRTLIFDPEEYNATRKQAFDNCTEEVKQFYGTKWMKTMDNISYITPPMQDPDLSPVTNDITHALFSVWPKYTYRSGGICKWNYYPLSLMPWWFSDWYFAMPAPDAVK